MTKTRFLLALLLLCPSLRAQSATTTQQLVFAGLRSVAQQGQVNAVQSNSAGNLYLLLNQGDGVRLLKTDNAATTILAQAQLGAAGDIGIALALDPSGNVYVTGTTSSTSLTASSGAAIPVRTDASTNSFVARFDPNLNPVFVTFTGGSRIAASALAVTADAVFVTGITYAANLPVTPNGIQQAPAYASSQNGFVEKFSASGATLLYATYLTGASGSTTPAAIAADTSDNAYITGQTTASGFPTIAALVPALLSNPSGFLTKLTPAGDGITFSTFIPGAGLTSLALDSTGQTLLLSGSVALGQFPVDTVATPIIPTTYQVLLRIPITGASVLSSTLLAPGTASSVAAAANGGAWVDGVFSAPLLPLTPLANLGSGFALHVPAGAAIDQTARFGGLPNLNPTYASLPLALNAIAVDPAGEPIVAGAIQPTASSSLLATETYDLPLRNAPTTALPTAISAAELTAATCNGSLCAGSAAYLAKLSPTPAAALSFSANALPFVVLRNLGSAEADTLALTATGSTLTSNCPSTLYAGGECDILLSSGNAGTLTATSTASTQSITYPAYSATTPSSTIVFAPKELDFGIQTSTSPTGTRIITVSNLGTVAQTFTSALDATVNPKSPTSSPFGETASDCPISGATSTKLLAAGATCHITLGLTAPASTASDGELTAEWAVGPHDVLLTGYSQTAALSVSASEIDFGTQYSNGLRLPRYLFLSNASSTSAAHAALSLPAGSPFTLTDACPATLLPNSVCRIQISYLAATQTSTDSVTLTLDQGLSVLITGRTLPPQSVTGATVNPNLTVSATALTFANAVAVTTISSATQTVTITNSGASAFGLALSLTGDFTDATSCGATLAGGQSCSVVLTFVPSQPGARQGLLSVTAGSGTTPAYVALTGVGSAILPANNGTLASGSIAIGQPVAQFYKVAQPFTSLTATATGPYTVILVEDAGFGPGTPAPSTYASTVTGTCRNCFLGVQFTPTNLGLQIGTLTLSSTAGGSPYVLNLTGTGLPLAGLLLTPLAQDFGTAPIHSTSGTQIFTLTNLTPLATAVTVATPALTGDFALASTSGGGPACGGALAYTASCFVSVAFSPTVTGSRTGTLALSTSNGTASATLTGTAIADPGLAINPLALTFANVPGASATTQTITLTNTGSAPLSIGVPSSSSSQFVLTSTCGTLAGGASCVLSVSFQASTATVAAVLSFPVATTSGTPASTTYTVALAGNYTAAMAGLEFVPGQLQYGPSPVGTETPTRQVTVNNLTGKTVALAVNLPRQFTLSGSPCTALGPNASCTFAVGFLPLTDGTISGSLYATAIPSDGSAALAGIGYVEGYGIGAGSLTFTGALIVNHVYNFGQVTSGQTLAQTLTLANLNPAGSPAITVRRVTSAPPFLATTTCGTALAVGQSCTVTVTYAPSNQVATGTTAPATTSDAGTLTIESDAATSPDTLNFTGQGVPVAVASPANANPIATYTLSQGSLTFATTTVGNVSAAQTVTLTNTGSVTLHVSYLFTSADFNAQTICASVVAGATCTLTVAAVPQSFVSPSGIRVASLEIASDSSTSLEFLSLFVTAAPSPLVLSPSTLNFGSLLVGATATLPVQVTNSGTTPIIFNAINATGDYTAAAGTCPATATALAAGTTCTVQATFKPSLTGTRTGTLSFATSASTNPLTVTLTGIGVQSQLTLTPNPLAFGGVLLGTPSTLSLTLRNTGSATITNLAVAVTGDYLVTVPCPLTSLAASASCVVQITFLPTALGARTGVATVTSSDPGSPASVPLTGTGLQGGGFTLTVNGAASATASVPSGQPATYTLTLTPNAGFTGAVALTCTPVVAGQYATCSLLPSTVTLNGSAQTATATINTITSVSQMTPPLLGSLQTIFTCLLLPGLFTLWRGRRNLRPHRMLLLAMFLSGSILLSTGCGGGTPTPTSSTLYTPAGTYQYQVTATSTSGPTVTQTVTLNLAVTAR